MNIINRVNEYITNIMRSAFAMLRQFYSKKGNKDILLLEAKPSTECESTQNICFYKDNEYKTEDALSEKSAKKRKKPPLTHFVSIPFNHKMIQEKLQEFKLDVMNNLVDKDNNDITENLFIRPEILHLTIGMLTLQDEGQLSKAESALQNCSTEIIKPFIKENGQLKIKVEGVESLNNNPKKTRVVFAKVVDESGHLQEMSDKIVNYFVENGVMKREYDKVKLHITLMNTTFRNRQKQSSGKRYPFTFNASKIIEAHKNTNFGEVTFNTLHISQRFKYTEDGYYYPFAKVDFCDNV